MQISGSLRKLTALSLMQRLSFQWSVTWEALTWWVFIIVVLPLSTCLALLALPPESRWGWVGVGGWSLSIVGLLQWKQEWGSSLQCWVCTHEEELLSDADMNHLDQVQGCKGPFVFVQCLSLYILKLEFEEMQACKERKDAQTLSLGKTQWRMASYTENDDIDKKLINMAKFNPI